MKKIYVLLMKTKTSTDRFIRFMTNYEYSHVAISLDKSCENTHSFGRKKPHSILNGGFVTENKNGAFFKIFNDTTCKIYEIETTDEQYNKLEDIIENPQSVTIKKNFENNIITCKLCKTCGFLKRLESKRK